MQFDQSTPKSLQKSIEPVLEHVPLNQSETKDLMKKVIRIVIMDVDNFIQTLKLIPVTSPFILDNATKHFHENGLFSEVIFGMMKSRERYLNLSYIDLHTEVLHPFICEKMFTLNRLYEQILKGEIYVKFDKKIKDFVITEPLDDKSNTGMYYFRKYIKEVDIDKYNTGAIKKDGIIRMLKKYKDRWFINKTIVQPAGFRDIDITETKPSKGDINSKYITLLSLGKSIANTETDTPLLNHLFWTIQSKLLEIKKESFSLLSGKHGIFQGKFGTRAVAQTTRNVAIAPSINETSKNDPTFLSVIESGISLPEFVKSNITRYVYYLSSVLNGITGIGYSKIIRVINPDTLEGDIIEITVKEQERHTTQKHISRLIDNFLDHEFRILPYTIKSKEGKDYYITLLYDDEETDTVFAGRSFAAIQEQVKKILGKDISKTDVKPVNIHDVFLSIANLILKSNVEYTTMCRYPIAGKWSHQEGKIKVITTHPMRSVKLYSIPFEGKVGDDGYENSSNNTQLNIESKNIEIKNEEGKSITIKSGNLGTIEEIGFMFQENDKNESNVDEEFKDITVDIDPRIHILTIHNWPSYQKGNFVDAYQIPIVYCQKLTADFDGDTFSNYEPLSEEAKNELKNHVHSLTRFIDSDLTFIQKFNVSLVDSFFKYIMQ